MRPRRGAPLAVVVALAIGVAALAGCSDDPDADASLNVYLSAPLSGPRAEDGRDVADGAELALADAGGEAGGVEVVLTSLDDATDDGWGAAAAADARTASEDTTAIAYIGELDSGASRTSIPITNQAGILQVSPGASAVDLTRDAPGSDGVPDVQASGDRTFGRVIPSDRDQGEAAAVWMAADGIAATEVLGGETPFGESLLDGFESAPGAPEIVSGAEEPDAAYDVQDDPFEDREPGFTPRTRGPLYGSDALLEPGDRERVATLAGSCRRPSTCPRGGSRDVLLTSAAMDPSQLPPAAADFLAAFEDEYGRSPGPYAAYGYEAMAVVLYAIDRADDPTDRGDVVDAFFATTDRDSILGSYSIDDVGDTTLPQLGAYEIGPGGVPRPEPEALTLP
ncbi:MAG: branched-chain amino acid ABC transporter substrate-binding protein [Solirubrobacterales bacterium]